MTVLQTVALPLGYQALCRSSYVLWFNRQLHHDHRSSGIADFRRSDTTLRGRFGFEVGLNFSESDRELVKSGSLFSESVLSDLRSES